VLPDALEKHCTGLELILDKKRFGQQKSGFCTFAAVDMQPFFHSRAGFSRAFATSTCLFCIKRAVSRTVGFIS
jgi:hypothetical protein